MTNELVNVKVSVSPDKVVEGLSEVQRRKLTIKQLGEIVTAETLTPEDLATVQKMVEVVNKYTEYRFTRYNSGVSEDVAKKLGLK